MLLLRIKKVSLFLFLFISSLFLFFGYLTSVERVHASNHQFLTCDISFVNPDPPIANQNFDLFVDVSMGIDSAPANIRVDWDDGSPISSQTTSASNSNLKFSHVYSSNQSITIRVTGTDNLGLTCSNQRSFTVQNTQPTVNLTADDTSISSGNSTTLRWTTTGSPSSCSASGDWSGSKSTSGGSESTGTLTGNGTYTITCSNSAGSDSDTVTVNVSTPQPTVTFTADDTSIPHNTSTILRWDTTNATSCTASNGWSGSKGIAGSESTGQLTSSRSYTINCSGAGGSTSANLTVNVGSAPTPGGFSLNSVTCSPSGGSATFPLSWGSSANATSYEVWERKWSSGSWNRITTTSGTSYSVSNRSMDTDYFYYVVALNSSGSLQSNTVGDKCVTQTSALTCSPASQTVQTGNTASFTASGGSGSYTWSASSGASPATGSGSSFSTTYTSTGSKSIIVNDGSNTATCALTVSSVPQAPTASITADDTSVLFGGSSTLTWSSTNTTSCTASGGWSGSKAISGSEGTGSLTSSQTYTITCTGSNGSATDSATVSVGSQPNQSGTLTVNSYESGNSSNTIPVDITGYPPSGSPFSLGLAPVNYNVPESEFGSWTISVPPVSGYEYPPVFSPTDAYQNISNGSVVNWDVVWTAESVNHEDESASCTVEVLEPMPTVDIEADPSSVNLGGSSTLTWSSTNSDSCTASGGWSGSKALSGNESTGTLLIDTTYTITCTGAGGQDSDSVTVTVGVGLSDLIINSGPDPDPSSITHGDTVDFTAVVENTGLGSTGSNFDIRFTVDGDEISVENSSSLGAGQTTSVESDSWTAIAGSHLVQVCADSGNDIGETDEGNNCASKIIVVSDPSSQCNNGIDDDGDSLTDLSDPGCSGPGDNNETNAQCVDTIDNDGDGWTDSADPGCWIDPNDENTYDSDDDDEAGGTTFQCSDSIDNDGDGFIDGDDSGCVSAEDNSEKDPEFQEF